MKRALLLFLITFNAHGWDLKQSRPWTQTIDAIISRFDITIIGETHGHPEHLNNYRALFQPIIRHSVDTVFLEWVYDHNQLRLNEYLSDAEAERGTVKEAYYICTLARNRLFDQGPGNPMITFEQFRDRVAPLSHLEVLLQTCDNNDDMRNTLRNIRRIKRSYNNSLKVCAVDYWDYDDEKDKTYAHQRIKEVPRDLRRVVTREFRLKPGTAIENVREIILTKNVIDCVNGRKKAVGIVGGGHAMDRMMAGAVKQYFARKEKVASVLQLANFTDDDGVNLNLQKRLMEIESPVIIPSRTVSREGRELIGSEAMTADYLVLTKTLARPHSPHAVRELEQKLLQMRGRN